MKERRAAVQKPLGDSMVSFGEKERKWMEERKEEESRKERGKGDRTLNK